MPIGVLQRMSPRFYSISHQPYTAIRIHANNLTEFIFRPAKARSVKYMKNSMLRIAR